MLRRSSVALWGFENTIERPKLNPGLRNGTVARPKDRRNLFELQYGWGKNMLPKFGAVSPYMRQVHMRRMLTDLVRRDHAIVAGARAPALRIMADHLVALAKSGTTDDRQMAAHFLDDPLMVDKAFDEYPRRFRDYHGGYVRQSKLRNRRPTDCTQLYFVEMNNRAMSDNHKGEDYSKGPERFFLPPRVIETERGIVRPPHMQMAFDRWASKFKTAEFHHWWKVRHAKLRFWGVRNVPHPADVDPLWTEKDEEEWHSEILASSGADDTAYDLDAEEDTQAK
uniref:50S ribosomal protein L17 n=1 Tax=Neobodo designis TaxID=312471 RepID=A0A7S1KWJ7_NEODS|mmetsp:Transcript_10281/g.31786  ORF Transcript_10281/g.31786 Transcript_10281/m.31786 type:complete len:281 (+) Transcript_10281:99-941(+)|eukprot:CAMPEP_0174854366 /NCGR_PEP_ID=MMETSP1114-20130205/30935_1 /TAXON_ID=312471 /ORGANISM="Neobodo designis, Strain CCAP 1951/1" /LENGTH=280 /DNA_ID=CAMNT_0016089055 /DNA_START=98 /DNA_END=940 /DNA_ORIENTATION=+